MSSVVSRFARILVFAFVFTILETVTLGALVPINAVLNFLGGVFIGLHLVEMLADSAAFGLVVTYLLGRK